jgi:hypothetical protein
MQDPGENIGKGEKETAQETERYWKVLQVLRAKVLTKVDSVLSGSPQHRGVCPMVGDY